MISFVYPLLDWDAAAICIRLQALLCAQNIKCYVVPRHAGRDEEIICKKLIKSKSIYVISTKKKKLDKSTLKEIEFYIKHCKKHRIVQFSPSVCYHFHPSECNIKFILYSNYSNVDLLDNLKDLHFLGHYRTELERTVEALITAMLMLEAYPKVVKK